MRLPISIVEWAARRGFLVRPQYLCIDVTEGPLEEELEPGLVYREVRGGHPKWAHLQCPRCADHIQVPIGGSSRSWRLSIDWLRRPTFAPSLWEQGKCTAHFFIHDGQVQWCREERRGWSADERY